MPENNELFSKIETGRTFPPVKSWQMVTNQSNLFYMIAAGMIMPPAGFGKKYYQDTASAFPGHLVLFPNVVPAAAVNFSVSEKEYLFPCIINLDMSCLSGPVKIVTGQNEVRDVNFPDEVDSSCQLMLVPAPLPVSWMSAIVCRSREDKTRCIKDAADFNNVDLSSYSIKSAAGAFTKLKNRNWPPMGIAVDPINVALGVPMAAGAMMGLLLNMNNCRDLSVLAARLAFAPDLSLPELAVYPVIAAMGEWLRNGGTVNSGDISQKLYWDIVGRVAISKYSLQQTSAIDVAIDYLETMPSEEFDEKTRRYGKKLSADLRSITGLADSTISEIFERHPKPVSRAMTLFVLREKIEDLLAFNNPQLTDADYILAAILFAAREGWIGLTKKRRKFPGLNAAVSHRMAAIAHSIIDSGLDLGPPPPGPLSLLELLVPAESPMSKAQKEASLYLARQLK